MPLHISLILAVCLLVGIVVSQLLRPILPAWRGWLRERAEWRRLDADLAREARERARQERLESSSNGT